MKFKCIKLLLSNWFSNEQSKTGSILFLYQMRLLWYPILTPPKTTVHIEDRATSQFEGRKMKSPDWCTHPEFCRIPQPSKWEIDLRSSLHKPVGVAGTCAKTRNKFIKPPSTLYPETTGKIWSLHKFFCCFFSSKTTPSERSNVTSPSYTNIILHIC